MGEGTNITPRCAQDLVGCRGGAFHTASAIGLRAQVVLDFRDLLAEAVNCLLELRNSLSPSLIVFEEAERRERSLRDLVGNDVVIEHRAVVDRNRELHLLLVHRLIAQRGRATSTVEVGGDERRHLALGRDSQLVGAEVVQLSDESRHRLER